MEVLSGASEIDETVSEVFGIVVMVLLLVVVNGTVVVEFPQFPVGLAANVCVTLFTTM